MHRNWTWREDFFLYVQRQPQIPAKQARRACKRRNRGEAFRPAAVSCCCCLQPYLFLQLLLILSTLYNSLCQHRVYDLLEACDVRAYHVVLREAVALCGVRHVVADVDHDALKLRVYLLEGPA